MIKKLLKSQGAQAVAAFLLAAFIRLVYCTNRKKRHIHPDALPYVTGEKSAIFAFWHGRMMMLPCFEPPGRRMHVLISGHRDGRLISRVIGHFGQATITGSSSRGGRAAVQEIRRVLEAGDNISITPDGPRGPFEVAAAGAARIATLTGYPIIPGTFSATRHTRFTSWDRFLLALPFGRIVFVAGAPISLPAPAEQDYHAEIMRLQLEKALRECTAEADNLAGVPPHVHA